MADDISVGGKPDPATDAASAAPTHPGDAKHDGNAPGQADAGKMMGETPVGAFDQDGDGEPEAHPS